MPHWYTGEEKVHTPDTKYTHKHSHAHKVFSAFQMMEYNSFMFLPKYLI